MNDLGFALNEDSDKPRHPPPGTRSKRTICQRDMKNVQRISIKREMVMHVAKLHPPSKIRLAFEIHGCFISKLVIIHYPSPECS